MNHGDLCSKLLGNAKAALTAAIEIYNKPVFQYREECVVILLLNAWELALKALLSQNKELVFQSDKSQKTLSWHEALLRAKPYFPKTLPFSPVEQNLNLLGIYRNTVVHFYSAEDFRVVLYALAQTSIKNLRDLIEGAFDVRLEEEINWCVLPLGVRPPVDIANYISGETGSAMTTEVRGFVEKVKEAAQTLAAAGEDTGRLLTVFNIKLESVKKIGDAGIVVRVAGADSQDNPRVLIRNQDPNKSHPLRQKEIMEKIGSIGGRRFTSYDFQAIVWKHGIKNNSQYCWKATLGELTRYSRDVVTLIKRCSAADIQVARNEYGSFIRSKREAK